MTIGLGVLKDLPDKTTGELTARNAQIISNVFIGRGKPWLAQLPLAELKPAEVDLLVHCATLSAFMVPHPPVTQLGVLKWAQEADRLDKLQEPTLSTVLRVVARWSAKWQGALRKEVEGLPEAIAAVLKPSAPEGSAAAAPEIADATVGEDEEAEAEKQRKPRIRWKAREGQEAPRKERRLCDRARRSAKPRSRSGDVARAACLHAAQRRGGGRAFNLNGLSRRSKITSSRCARNSPQRRRSRGRRKAIAVRAARKGAADHRRRADARGTGAAQSPTRSPQPGTQARIEELTQHSEDVARAAARSGSR